MENQNIEEIVNQDLSSLPSGFRLFDSNHPKFINDLTKNVIKYFPTSILLKIQALGEYGKTAILLEIEKQLVSLSKDIVPTLAMQLKSHSNSWRAEVQGILPSAIDHVTYFTNTIREFCDQISSTQRTILCLEFNNDDFANEFIDYLKPLFDNMPIKLFIYVINGSGKLYNTEFRHALEQSYYWNNPLSLGSNLQFLSKNHSSSLIEYITNNEIVVLLRLWGLSDIAIPFIEKAIQSLPKYSHQEILILLNNEEFSFTINNSDRFEAEYKLYRELAFHYASSGGLKKANKYEESALKAIEKSIIPTTTKTKYIGWVWGDRAEFEKNRLNFSEAIKYLIIQKSIYESNKDSFVDELSAISHNLGICYRANTDYKNALIELNLSLELSRKLKKEEAIASTILELGKTYVDLEDYKSALLYFKQVENSLSEGLDVNTLYLKGTALAYIVYINKELGVFENLLTMAGKAMNIFSALGAVEDIEKLQGVLDS